MSAEWMTKGECGSVNPDVMFGSPLAGLLSLLEIPE